jgi:response regulator RpfG family c-di-GMP phosphodiesterase
MHSFTDRARGFELSDAETITGTTTEAAVPPAQALLAWLLDAMVVLPEEWEELSARDREDILGLTAPDLLLGKLVQKHLLTVFQAEAVRKGWGEDLVLGHYRLLDLCGQGGMGTVYRAEHVRLRRQVALKVMARAVEGNPRLLHRFYAEARAVARLQHPNIVACFDAGRAPRTSPDSPVRDYFVMEFIPGQDLYGLIREKGPLSPHRACDLFRQVAEALGEAHRHGLVHRDIKPSNVLVTPDWQAKVLDFGLARLPAQGNMTEPGTLLGTVGYMAPEQARDPHGVDARADLFSLGATMYWALTGREPYPETGNPVQDLHRRLTTSPPPVRRVRPEIPAEVSDLVARLMDADPDQRYPSARAVATTLHGFALWLPTGTPAPAAEPRSRHRDRVLLVEDDPTTRGLMAAVLKDHFDVREAETGDEALVELTRNPPDLAVVDVNLPGVSGPDLIGRFRAALPDPDRVKVLLVSGDIPAEALGGLTVSGADDFLSKPFAPVEFLSRVRTLLLRRANQNGPAGLTKAGPTVRVPAAAMVRPTAPAPPPVRPTAAAEALSFTISQLLVETNVLAEGHWGRIVRYVRALASAATDQGEHARLKDEAYLQLLAAVAPVYDAGLLAVPRNVLMKPDRLDPDERSVIQTHTTQGSEVLLAVAGKFAADLPSLPMAAEVARSHHERWDGAGYPDQLAGAEIPLSARVVAIVSVYEALRSRRPHRPPLSHARAVKIITTECAGQFDPALVAAFTAAAPRFEQIYQGG